jgi:hypothetical protein
MHALPIVDQLRISAAQRAYASARARYVRAETASRAAVRIRPLQLERTALAAECARMQAAQAFHTVRLERAQLAFEREVPGRSWGSSIERPTFLDRILTCGLSDRLYREVRLWMFCRAEVTDELVIRRERLQRIGEQIEALLRAEKAAVEHRLNTPAGLSLARAQDAQLALAHARLAEICG